MIRFKFRKFEKGSRDYKTLANMLEMCKEIDKIYTYFEGCSFLENNVNAGNLCYDMIIEFLELPEEKYDWNGKGFCYDYWFNIVADFIDGKISIDKAIKLMTKDFDYDVID